MGFSTHLLKLVSVLLLVILVLLSIPQVNGYGRATRPTMAYKSYMIYYGAWDTTMIPRFQKYHLVVLDPNSGPSISVQPAIIKAIQVGADGISGTADDVAVLGYISVGEDRSTGTNPGNPPSVGDGSGPCYINDTSMVKHCEYKGIASYYIDAPPYDGIPERQSTWGGCYVDPYDPNWQNYLIGTSRPLTSWPLSVNAIIGAGYDGLFLDAIDIGDPYQGFGWTARGISSVIQKFRALYPNILIAMNRGFYFLMPIFAYQYSVSPAPYIDFIVMESYFMDNAYGTTPFHLSPYIVQNINTISPQIAAEAGRSSNPIRVLQLDYAQIPSQLAANYPSTYLAAINSSMISQGRLEYFQTITITDLNDVVINNPPAADLSAPSWVSTSNGYWIYTAPSTTTPWNCISSVDIQPPPSRMGVQQLVPSYQTGSITVQWDLAMDQTLPVRYNIYVSTSNTINFQNPTIIRSSSVGSNSAPSGFTGTIVFPAVKETMPSNYATRDPRSGSTALPYQFTVTNLQPNVLYYFAVRAEDSTVGVTSVTSGRIGWNNGIEETNTVILSSTITTSSTAVNLISIPQVAGTSSYTTITVDGSLNDWNAVAWNDNWGGIVPGFKVCDDQRLMSFAIYLASTVTYTSFNTIVYLDTDTNPQTGYLPGRGAEYKIGADHLVYKYNGATNSWVYVDSTAWSWVLINGQLTAIEFSFWKASIGWLPYGTNIGIYSQLGTWVDVIPAPWSVSGMGYKLLPSDGIIIDGYFSDWVSNPTITFSRSDPINDGRSSATNALVNIPIASMDILNVETSVGSAFFRILIQYSGQCSYISTPLSIFFDTDTNANTGFSINIGKIGADYLFTGGSFYKFGGATQGSWTWNQITTTPELFQIAIGVSDPTKVEMMISRSVFSMPTGHFGLFIISADSYLNQVYDYFPELGYYLVV